jgi:hypothetical protein
MPTGVLDCPDETSGNDSCKVGESLEHRVPSLADRTAALPSRQFSGPDACAAHRGRCGYRRRAESRICIAREYRAERVWLAVWSSRRKGLRFMRNVLTITALVAVFGLAATTATAPKFSSDLRAQAARAMLDGVILGSSAWPSVPVDARVRLQLWSPDCDSDGRCKAGSATLMAE